MNLRIGKIKSYNNKISISSPSFKIGTNLKINLDDDEHIEKDKPDVKYKKEEMIKTKPDIKSNKEHKQDIEMTKTKPDMNGITYEEEKVALILGITAIFTIWWMFKSFIYFLFLS